MGIDILNLEWNSFQSRDRETATLISNYLRHAGYSVYEGPMHDAYFLINVLKPKLVFFTNSLGARLNMSVLRYVKSKGIYCVAGVSEGNFNEVGIEQFIWGHNLEKVQYEDKWLLWSSRAQKLVKKYHPSLIKRTAVSGAVGFDRYTLLSEYPRQVNRTIIKGYDKVIGVGCWDFGFTDKNDTRYATMNGLTLNAEQIEKYALDRENFNRELLKLIADNQDVLFILKQHPGVQLGVWASAIEGCDKYANVLIVKNELSILEALEISDIWISYESNTALEAWLIGKQTGLLNPNGLDLPIRHKIHKGQPNFPTADEWTCAIKHYYDTGILPLFDKYKNIRDEIIEDVIQWSDGLNHVRFGNAIIDMLESNTKPRKIISSYEIGKRDKHIIIRSSLSWKLYPFLRFAFINELFKSVRRRWNSRELKSFANKRYIQQMEFYRAQNLSREELRKIKAI